MGCLSYREAAEAATNTKANKNKVFMFILFIIIMLKYNF